MGKYINPPDTTKEAWLQVHGTPVTESEARAAAQAGGQPVCLVDNGPFRAAGIAYDMREFEAFAGMREVRPRQWYVVPAELLAPYL